MSVKFLDTLNALTNNSSLYFRQFNEVNTNGNLNSEFFLFSDNTLQCYAKFLFRFFNGTVVVSSELSNNIISSNHNDLDKHLVNLEKAIGTVKHILKSNEVMEGFLQHAKAITEKTNAEYKQQVDKISATHILIDRKSAKTLLESFINIVRDKKEEISDKPRFYITESGKERVSRGECITKLVTLLSINKDGTVSADKLTIRVDKRTSLWLNSNIVSKPALLDKMVGMWAPKI